MQRRARMMMVGCLATCLMMLSLLNPVSAAAPRFVSIALGVTGGLSEGNLPAYLLAPSGSSDFIALDAGTLLTGLQQARIAGNLDDMPLPADSTAQVEGYVLQHHVKAYLISHAHLDHVAGLVLNSPDDSAKPLLGTAATLDTIRDHLFNWKVWPNFGDEGEGFQLKKYHYVRLAPKQEQPIDGTTMTVTPFELCHSGVSSTAYLIQANGAYALYFGDTGPDEAEKCDNLNQVWQAIAPLIREQKLAGMFLESSYPDPREAKQLFGHLTPTWMLKELHRLADLVNPEQPNTALAGLRVLVTHIKPALEQGISRRDQIMKQLEAANDLGVTFIFPAQGDRIEF